MTYSSEVLTDTPWGYWRMLEASGSWLDATGHGHTMTVTGDSSITRLTGSPGYAPDDSPIVGGGASTFFDWTATCYGRTADVMSATEASLEVWVHLDGTTPGSRVPLLANGNATTGTGATEFSVQILSDQRVEFYMFNGSGAHFIYSTAPISNTAWAHIVAVADASSTRLYVNGAQVASAPDHLSSIGRTMWIHASGYSSGGQRCTIAEPAIYDHALSATRVAAHYAAATSVATTGTVAATLPSFGAALAGTSTPPATTGTLAGTLQPPTVALAGTSLPPGVAGLLGATLPPFTGTLAGTSTPPPVTGTVAATVPPFTVTLAGVTELFGDKLTAVLPALGGSLQGQVTVITATDTTYANDSYSYGGTAQVDYAPPVAPPPPGLVRRDVRRVHQSLPTPNLVRGRPQ